MIARFEGEYIFLQLSPKHKSYTENVLNGLYNKKRDAYRFPRNIFTMRELLRAFPELREDTHFIDIGRQMAATRHNFLDLKRQTDSQFVKDDRLRPYQRADVEYLMRMPAAGIFNEPRTGKTPTSIILMKELGTKRNLVVAPASLIWNWAKEFERWYPEASVCVYDSVRSRKEPPSSTKYDVFIVSKDILKNRISFFQELYYDAAFIDEAHYLRNYKSNQSKAIYQINAERKYALTGTPTVKHPADIWGILHFLYPQKFPSYWQFIDRYFEQKVNWAGYNELGGVKPHRKDELEELIGFISVQRKRKEVMEWLPDKERITTHCKMEGKQLKLYNQMKDDFLASDEEGNEVDTPGVLSQLMRLRQICLDPTLLELKAPSAKTEALFEYLENNNEPVVIMSMFTSYLHHLKELLQKQGEKVGEINGKMSNHEKEKNAMAFQNGDTRILLCNIISAGTGFTLDRAETILFTDYPYNPSELEQAEDRIIPTTKERNHKCTIVSFVCSDSVDEKIQKIIENKKSLTDVINEGGREAIRRLLS